MRTENIKLKEEVQKLSKLLKDKGAHDKGVRSVSPSLGGNGTTSTTTQKPRDDESDDQILDRIWGTSPVMM